MRVRSQVVRRTAAVAAGLSLAAGAVALGTLPAGATPAGTTAAVTTAAQVAAPTITIGADRTTAKAWSTVTLTGRTTHLATNTTVQVQRLESGRWVKFAATTRVTSKAGYSVRVQSGRVGVNKFRVVAGTAASPAVSVTITK